jgi:hypothetical protein
MNLISFAVEINKIFDKLCAQKLKKLLLDFLFKTSSFFLYNSIRKNRVRKQNEKKHI